jgi:hypothetical protein
LRNLFYRISGKSSAWKAIMTTFILKCSLAALTGVILAMMLVGCAQLSAVEQLKEAGIWGKLAPDQQAQAMMQDAQERSRRVAAALADDEPVYVPHQQWYGPRTVYVGVPGQPARPVTVWPSY